MGELFHIIASKISTWTGSAWTFMLALATIIIWATTGPLFNFSDTWQLVINTSTTVITFLMVFLIQNSQNRDSRAIQIKLDELLKGVKGARTELVDIEDLPDGDLEKLHKEFKDIHETYTIELEKRGRKETLR